MLNFFKNAIVALLNQIKIGYEQRAKTTMG